VENQVNGLTNVGIDSKLGIKVGRKKAEKIESIKCTKEKE